MITANSHGVNQLSLEVQIDTEMRQPEGLIVLPPPPLDLSGAILPVEKDVMMLVLKQRLSAIPVLGPALVMMNVWRRRLLRGLRILPVLGYGMSWLKSLLLVHETRGIVSIVTKETGYVEQRMRAEIAHCHSQLQDLRKQTQDLRKHIGLTEQRLADMRQEVAVKTVHTVARPDALDSFYAAFEASFRGSREDLKNRQRIYLDRVAGVSTKLPVLDIGCGRGEWIELLGERGVPAYGIDLNRIFVSGARKANLDVRETEALAHLRSLEDASLSGISAFHFIEHLQFSDLISVIDEAKRVLAPGGFLLLETPNPENLMVGASTFWSDPTHRAPLRPGISKFMVEQRGFVDAEIIYLHPDDDQAHFPGSDAVASRLNQLFYGARDYAIWARKA